MNTRKNSHHEAIRERARRAIADLYHNATVNYPRELYGRPESYFEAWFRDTAEFEIDYLQSGGAYGLNYHRTLSAPCNAGRYKSTAARTFYCRNGMRKMREERERCNSLDSRRHSVNCLWEYMGEEFGKLYQYGRGGRTLAPDVLMTGGYSKYPRVNYCDEMPISDCVRVLRIVESFNRRVRDWCADVPEMWREHCEAEDEAELQAKRAAAARKAKETRERNYWASRDVATVN